jgi:hypothetical protein
MRCRSGPRDLQSQRAAHAGGEHVDPPADRHGPGVSDARKFHRSVEFGDQLLLRHPARPPLARLQHDHGFEHRERRHIRGRIGSAGLAQDMGHLGQALQSGVGELSSRFASVIEMAETVEGI